LRRHTDSLFHAQSITNPHTNGIHDAHTRRNTDFIAYSFPGAYCDPKSKPHSNPNHNDHAYSHGDADTTTHTVANSNTEPHTHADLCSICDSYARSGDDYGAQRESNSRRDLNFRCSGADRDGFG
jgi:hypothetical protein